MATRSKAVIMCSLGIAAIGALLSLLLSKRPTISALAFNAPKTILTTAQDPLSIPKRVGNRLEAIKKLNAINCNHWGAGFVTQGGNQAKDKTCNWKGETINTLFILSWILLLYGIEEFWREATKNENKVD